MPAFSFPISKKLVCVCSAQAHARGECSPAFAVRPRANHKSAELILARLPVTAGCAASVQIQAAGKTGPGRC